MGMISNIIGFQGKRPARVGHYRCKASKLCFQIGLLLLIMRKLMGQADLQVLRRYLAQTTEDIAQVYQ